MNYTNPMSMMTLGAVRSTSMPFVGLCHSVQGNSRHLAHCAGVPYEEMVWTCAGINHLAWFMRLEHKGKNLYPVLLEAIKNPEIYEQDPVRWEMMKEFGYFTTESSGHFSEYVPYFRKRKDLLEKYCRGEYRGASGFYAKSWPSWRKGCDEHRKKLIAGKAEIRLNRSFEYAADIIEAHQSNRPTLIWASVPNTGLIPNLLLDGVVEVAVLVDSRGYTPTYFGPLPEQLAMLCRNNMSVFELCVSGILNKDKETVIRSFMADPLSAAVCSQAEIRQMAEELFKAEKPYIPNWCAQNKIKVSPKRKR